MSTGKTHIKAGKTLAPKVGVFTACGLSLTNPSVVEPDAIRKYTDGSEQDELRLAARECGVTCDLCLHSSFIRNGGMF